MHSSFAGDRKNVIQNAIHAGVSPLIITGAGEKSSAQALDYAGQYNKSFPGALYATAWVHPHEARFCGDGTISALKELAQKYHAVAIGECGLDYNRDFSPRDIQRKWFEKQIELAAELELPLFLHERDASKDFTAILKNSISKIRGAVVHCFTGNESELDTYLALGCYIGLTGWICDERRGTHLINIIKKISGARLMLETDAPFILPRDLPFKVQNRRNEPKYLPHIANAIARFQDKEGDRLALETFENTKRFFGI
jgi:TatD DNase family protein